MEGAYKQKIERNIKYGVVVNVLLSFALGANAGCAVIVAKYAGAKNNKKLRETVFRIRDYTGI